MPTCSLERLQPTECPSLSLLVSVGLTARVHPPSQWWVDLGWSSAPPRPLTEKKTNNIFSFFFFFRSWFLFLSFDFDCCPLWCPFRIARAAVKPCSKSAATSWDSCPLSISSRSITVNLTRPLVLKSVPSVSNDPQSLQISSTNQRPSSHDNKRTGQTTTYTHTQTVEKEKKKIYFFLFLSLTHKSTGARW